MDIKVNNIGQTAQVAGPEQPKEVNGDFKFMLTSKLEDTGLAERLNLMLQDIVQQGKQISKKNDIRDMQRYRLLIKNCKTQRHQRHAALQDSYKRLYE